MRQSIFEVIVNHHRKDYIIDALLPNGNWVFIWEDGDVIFETENGNDIDLLIPYGWLRQILKIADEFVELRKSDG